jgi:uncharacterized caspase-like protein
LKWPLSRSGRPAHWILALLLCLCAATSQAATRHALLVGVSQYPDLGPELQLKAPVNDVRLLREVLMQRGFEATRIEVLADGLEGAKSPTQAAILSALQSLATRVGPGDTVVLHFSGHGSLQWADGAPPVASDQPVRWQPVFLPRDAQGWNGRIGQAVTHAITDQVLRRLVDRINERGAFVFAVFDACHSAKLVRGALPGTDASQLTVRQVAPSALGLQGEPPPDIRPSWADLRAGASAPTDQAGERGRAVYFYAAQSVELAAAMPQQVGGEPRWHGLLTWNVAQAIALGQRMSYRQMAQHVLWRYDRLPASTATPLFSGDGLDQAVFDQSTPVVRQWPVDRSQGQLSLPAGALFGLGEGALLALITDPLMPAGNEPMQPPQGTLGFLRLVSVEAGSSRLQPVAWQGWAAPSPQALPRSTWARLIYNPPAFGLRIAIDLGACGDQCPAGRALTRLQRTGVPGVDARWVGASELPDVVLRATRGEVQMLLPGAAAASAIRWSVSATGGDEALQQESLSLSIADGLHRVARTRNLLRLASQMAIRALPGSVAVSVVHRRSGTGAGTPVAPDQILTAAPGDALLVEVRNLSADPVDFAAFWVGADHGIRQVYPQDKRDSPRLNGSERPRQFLLGIDPDSNGLEQLVVLSSPMRPGRESNDFKFLEQGPLARVRGASDPELQALLDACFADHLHRGEAAPALPRERLWMQLYTFRLEP